MNPPFYLITHKKETEKFRVPVLSTATGILDDLFFPESLGKRLFFTVLSSNEEPSWLALLNRVSLIGIVESRCRVTGAEWILFSSFFSLPISRDAIVVVLTGIFTPRQTISFQLVIFKIFFCLFLFLFWEFFSLKITFKISKTAPHRKYVHTFEKLKRNDCFLSMTMETHFVTNSAVKKSVFECSRKDILLADFVRHFEFMLNLPLGKF